ncbi:hypothetical protein K474DRAFT_1659260 [Panus rudis PR-1116 ss-1]|nr:hypothetical protein K474DRAFT_1659260 [Panus rudis PR-1116 ss-1]
MVQSPAAPSSLAVTLIKPDTLEDETLLDILHLSNEIFAPDPDSKYASLSVWRERLSHPSSLIIYLTVASEHKGTTQGGPPVAFLFAHPKRHIPPLSNGETESLHVWLAGVLPSWRKGGCLRRMMDALPIDSHRVCTICTIPSRFPDMWAWLVKRGWSVERELEVGKFLLSKQTVFL